MWILRCNSPVIEAALFSSLPSFFIFKYRFILFFSHPVKYSSCKTRPKLLIPVCGSWNSKPFFLRTFLCLMQTEISIFNSSKQQDLCDRAQFFRWSPDYRCDRTIKQCATVLQTAKLFLDLILATILSSLTLISCTQCHVYNGNI